MGPGGTPPSSQSIVGASEAAAATAPDHPDPARAAADRGSDGTSPVLSTVEAAALRAKMRDRLEALRLRRQPVTEVERAAAATAMMTHQRAQRAARMREPVSRFPLRPAVEPDAASAPAVPEEGDTDGVSRLLDAVFGAGTGPDEDPFPDVPKDGSGDDHRVAPLPATAVYLQDLSRTAPSTAPLSPVGDPVSIPLDLPPDWEGCRQWGHGLRVEDLSAADARDLRRLLYKELSVGALRVRTTLVGIRLVTPVFVHRNESGKLRLVHDLRPLNARMPRATVKYETVRDALSLRGSVASKLDLACAFKHVSVTSEAEALMAFQVGDVYFTWRRLPFGMAWSPTLFNAAIAPVIEAARAQGIRLVAYVDDVLVVADSVRELDDAMLRLLRLLRERGWRVAPDKAFPFAFSSITFLGLVVHPGIGRLTIPHSKAAKLGRMCAAACEMQRVPLHLLQKITGLLAFFLAAVPTVGLFWRALQGAQVDAELLPGRHVWRQGGLDQELQWWRDQAPHLPSWPDLPIPEQLREDLGLATDASEDGTGAIWWDMRRGNVPDLALWAGARGGTDPATCGAAGHQGGVTQGHPSGGFRVNPLEIPTDGGSTDQWGVGAADVRLRVFALSDDESAESSAVRELLGLCKALEDRFPAATPEPGLQSARIRWFSDSQAAVCALRKWRSRSLPVSLVLRRLLRLVVSRRLVIVPAWVSRELGWLPAADYLSRVVGRRRTAEWSIPAAEFRRACAVLRIVPSLDAFATRANARCRAFRSQHAEAGGRVDAFGAPWPRATYAFPPFGLLSGALAHWAGSGRTGDRLLLLAPRDFVCGDPRVRVVQTEELAAGTRLLDPRWRRHRQDPPRDLVWRLLRRL